MSLSSVMNYVKDELDGLAAANYQPAVAVVTPPNPGNADPGTPQLFVWTDQYTERRRSAPRGMGLKDGQHKVQVYVLVIDNPDDPNADTAFANLLEQVMSTLRQVALPVTLTDPDTGIESRISEIGESFGLRVDAIRALATERYTRWLAVLTVDVFESLIA